MRTMTDKRVRRRPSDVPPRRTDRDCAARAGAASSRPVVRERRRMPDVGPPQPPPIITLARL
jgi:hypothetical protein